ncbi:MAG: ABC transporter substrate-binding protein [Planctomycetaceae bacterium]
MRNSLFFLTLGLLSLCGCGSSEDAANADTSGTETPEVTVILNWFPEAEHGGFYAASIHGFYEEVGLNVVIKKGGPGTKVVANVEVGRVTFGVANADKILNGCAQGADVVALMAPIQDCPRCILVHEESGIESLNSLSDVTLSMSAGQPYAQFLKKHVPLKNVKVAPFNGGVKTFMRGPKFAQQAYSFSEPFTAKKLGAKPRTLMVSEIGFNPYTSVLIAGRETVEGSPKLVQKFVDASIRGWEKYLSEPDETNKHIQSINPEMTNEILDFGVEALRPLCRIDDTPMGSMTLSRWQTLESQLQEVGLIKPGETDVKRIVWQPNTNE